MLYEKWNYILAIAEEQNLTRAAKRLYISQPALTLYLNRLEADLGVKLFDRSKTPVVATKAGKYYIEEMKKISASEQMLRSEIRMIADPAQNLIISIGQVRGHHWLPMMLPAFCAIHPNVNIQAVQGTEHEHYIGKSLSTGKIDVTFGVLPAMESDIEVVNLMYEQLFLAAHRQFGLIPASKRHLYSPFSPCPITPQQLDSLPFIIPQLSNSLYSSYEEIILGNQIRPSRTISVSNLNTGLQLALQGLGVQLLSGSILTVEKDLESQLQDLDFCVLENMPSTRKCSAAYSRDNVKQKLISDLIQIVKEQVLPRCPLVRPIEP